MTEKRKRTNKKKGLKDVLPGIDPSFFKIDCKPAIVYSAEDQKLFLSIRANHRTDNSALREFREQTGKWLHRSKVREWRINTERYPGFAENYDKIIGLDVEYDKCILEAHKTIRQYVAHANAKTVTDSYQNVVDIVIDLVDERSELNLKEDPKQAMILRREIMDYTQIISNMAHAFRATGVFVENVTLDVTENAEDILDQIHEIASTQEEDEPSTM